MKLLLRILKYLAPSKGKIALVILVSMLTSLFSVVSIYSILPLLNEVFTPSQPARAGTPAGVGNTSPGLKLQQAESQPATSSGKTELSRNAEKSTVQGKTVGKAEQLKTFINL